MAEVWARDIRRPLMMAVGTSDHGCMPSAMKMTRSLIEAGVDHDLLVIPQAFHAFFGAELDYFLMKLCAWMDRHVKERASQ